LESDVTNTKASLDIAGGITVIGDSVPLAARTTIQDNIPDCDIDAVVGRQVVDGADVLTNIQNRGELREYVVIALGTNGTNSYKQLFTEIIDVLNPGHRLIFVTPFDGRADNNAKLTSEIAVWLRELPMTYDFITVADWSSIISPQVDLLAADKVHMKTEKGAASNLYAEALAAAIAIAAQKPAKQ
jgi:hypothetical protein